MAKILVVEDEKNLAVLIKNWLERESHLVDTVQDGLTALHYLKVSRYDFVILDWMLPKLSGLEVCKQYRAEGGDAHILMLTAKDSLDEKGAGFDVGVDDYLTKPFELRELAMRIKAHMRRAQSSSNACFKLRDIEVDTHDHYVRKNGLDVHLQPKEFRLLEYFIRHPHRVFSAEELLSAIWESDTLAQTETVRGHITRIRKKLDSTDKPSIIATVHGVGYKLGPTDA